MSEQWGRYRQYCLIAGELGIRVDVSRVPFPDDYIAGMASPISAAMDAMNALEAGAQANADEGRMVGHYWLRAPARAPSAALRAQIETAVRGVSEFAGQVRSGGVRGAGGAFRSAIHVGIGGSALGPQLMAASQDAGQDALTVHVLDNADPDHITGLLRRLGPDLGRTLVSVVSKSGWTPTPWRVMTELEDAYATAGLDFARHAVATTMAGTRLDARAAQQRWLARFPLWDWVGGRTSVTSPVGLLPAALQGIDTAALLRGAAGMDDRTRRRDPWQNPAMMLALAWYWLGRGRGDKHMVVLPYRDRLDLFPRYVQQLVMESVGKRADRSGKVVRQGLTVYGHKGVTDQHAYVQQLREGRDDAFVTFIAVDTDRDEPSPRAGPSLGDHLFANLEGLRDALTEQGRASVTISLTDAGPASLGALIALHERAVGLYAELADLNAYHQPGVDKDIAAPALSLRHAALEYLRQEGGPATAQEIAAAIGQPDRVETVYRALRREALRATGPVRMETVAQPFGERFSWRPEGPAAQPERRSAATGAPAGR